MPEETTDVEEEMNAVENWVDATELFEVYENGKTVECPQCGHGIGVPLEQANVKCADCGSLLIDKEVDSRDEQYDGQSGQTGLGDWA